MYILSMMILGLDSVLSLLLLSASFLTSYARARGEALGVNLKGVGLIERQERVIAILLILALLSYNRMYANLAASILLILSVVTVAQRVARVKKILSKEA